MKRFLCIIAVSMLALAGDGAAQAEIVPDPVAGCQAKAYGDWYPFSRDVDYYYGNLIVHRDRLHFSLLGDYPYREHRAASGRIYLELTRPLLTEAEREDRAANFIFLSFSSLGLSNVETCLLQVESCSARKDAEGAANLRTDIYCRTFFFADYPTAKRFKIIKD